MTQHNESTPSGTALQGDTVLVTGAAGDIGRAAATRFASEGANSILADIEGSDGLEATAEICRSVNPNAEHQIIRFDVTSEDEVQAAFAGLVEDGVIPNLLFNNAGYQGSFVNVVDYDSDDFRRVLDINVTGVFHVLKHFARTLIDSGGIDSGRVDSGRIDSGLHGAIVNTASMAHGGAPNMAAYSASKAAVIALTKSAAKDLADRSIRVNSISPAFIGPGMMWDRQVQLQADAPSQYFADTPDEVAKQMISAVPLRRYGSLDEVASAALFLLSDEASYITAFDIEVSGGAV